MTNMNKKRFAKKMKRKKMKDLRKTPSPLLSVPIPKHNIPTNIQEDVDAFVEILGEDATPYVDFLEELTNEGEFWCFQVRNRLLQTKYGMIFTDVWRLMKDEDEKNKGNVTCYLKEKVERKHPAQIFAIIKDEWKTFLTTENPSIENLKSSIYSIWIGCQIDALCELLDEGKLEHLTDKEYWELVMEFWINAENPSTQSYSWNRLFEEREPDTSTTNELPKEITIYRAGHPSGLSWSLSFDVAKWFVRRCNGEGLWETKVRKKDILFYTNGREEEEIILRIPQDPEKVNRVVVREEVA